MPAVVRKLFRMARNSEGWYIYPYTNPPPDESSVSGLEDRSWRKTVCFCCQMNRAAECWLRTNELTVAHEDLIAVLERSVRCLRAERGEIEEYRDMLIDEVEVLRSITQIQSGIITILEAKLDGES